MADNISATSEVERLHQDLEAWIGRGEASAWPRFEAALADDFVQIGPDGIRRNRDKVVGFVANLQGIADDGFTIRIEDAEAHPLGDRFALVRYREVQAGGRNDTNRWASAVLSRAPNGGWRWHHLHECWVV